MKLIVQYTNNENTQVILPEPTWSYEVRFNANATSDSVMLSIVNATAKFLDNQELIDLFYTIQNTGIENVQNILLMGTRVIENELEEYVIFDAIDLMLDFKEINLEYISNNDSLTRPGVGTLFTFRFNNTYVSQPRAIEIEMGE